MATPLKCWAANKMLGGQNVGRQKYWPASALSTARPFLRATLVIFDIISFPNQPVDALHRSAILKMTDRRTLG
jgi:hypothetical protein